MEIPCPDRPRFRSISALNRNPLYTFGFFFPFHQWCKCNTYDYGSSCLRVCFGCVVALVGSVGFRLDTHQTNLDVTI
jgi:hypothetical protein